MRTRLAVAAAIGLLGAAATVRANGETTPATRAAERVMEQLDEVRETLQETRYQHHRAVRVRRGEYFFDCSGMVQWVLSRVSRRAALDLDEGQRPLAIHFVRRIQRAPTGRFHGGWRRIERMSDVRPGDVFAWERPEDFRSRNTGHVGFVIRPPERVAGSRVYAVRVADASRYTHQDDTRPWPGPGGFGHGTLAFVVDERDRPIGYAWRGLESRGYRETDVVFGRVGP